MCVVFRIHPRDKQDVAFRLTLGARAVAYDEPDVPFQGPFPRQIQSKATGTIIISYDQKVSVTPSNNTFQVRSEAGRSVGVSMLTVTKTDKVIHVFFSLRSVALRIRLPVDPNPSGLQFPSCPGVPPLSTYLLHRVPWTKKWLRCGTPGETGPATSKPVPSTARVGFYLRRRLSPTSTQLMGRFGEVGQMNELSGS